MNSLYFKIILSCDHSQWEKIFSSLPGDTQFGHNRHIRLKASILKRMDVKMRVSDRGSSAGVTATTPHTQHCAAQLKEQPVPFRSHPGPWESCTRDAVARIVHAQDAATPHHALLSPCCPPGLLCASFASLASEPLLSGPEASSPIA